MKWWQVMTPDGVRPSIPRPPIPTPRPSPSLHLSRSLSLTLSQAPSILRRPHHEIHFNAIAEAEYHPRFGAWDASDTPDEPISTISSSSFRG